MRTVKLSADGLWQAILALAVGIFLLVPSILFIYIDSKRFFSESGIVLIIGGLVCLAFAGRFYFEYRQEKKDKEELAREEQQQLTATNNG
jgi:hypothetical protein